jgi:outer membrane lipoprotein-sorting protein
MRFVLVLLLGLLSAGLRAQAPDVAAILQRTAEKYSNLTSTSFRTTTTLIDQNQRDPMAMEVAFRRPDKARLLVRGPGVGQAFGLPANELLIVVDGLYTWMYVPVWKQYTREAGGFIRTDPNDSGSPVKLGSAAGFVSHMVESIEALLRQQAGAAGKMRLAGDETLHIGPEAVECYVIESKSRKPPSTRLWIDKARYVLVQEETSAKGSALLRTSFSDVAVNQPLPDSLFVFTPADDAVLMQKMEPPNPHN